MCVQDWPCEKADAIAMCGVVENGGFGEATVGQAEEFFAKACFDADTALGEPAACRWFLNWHDDTPRDEMRRELLSEVEQELNNRKPKMITKPPAGSVVVSVPRSELPAVFNTEGYHQEHPYIGVDTYNLVIVPAGIVRTRLDSTDLLSFGHLYSGKSGRLYEWGDYYRGEFGRRTTEVGGEKVFVECVPDKKDYNQAPREVNLYLSTAGVVWLALRTILGPNGSMGRDALAMTEIEDAPFGAYLDRLDELGGHDSLRDRLRFKLLLFFGLSS
jgi:hypothetical protein